MCPRNQCAYNLFSLTVYCFLMPEEALNQIVEIVNREKWAWYTLWLVPALLVGSGLFNAVFLGDVNEMLQWIPITTVSLLVLLLPYRKFFPR